MPFILIALVALLTAGVGWFKYGSHCGGACPYSQRQVEPARMGPAPHHDPDADADWKTRCRVELERARDTAPGALAKGSVREVTLFAENDDGGQAFVEYELGGADGQLYQVSVAEAVCGEHNLGWHDAGFENKGNGQVRRMMYLHQNGLLVSLHGEGEAAQVAEFTARFRTAVDNCAEAE